MSRSSELSSKVKFMHANVNVQKLSKCPTAAAVVLHELWQAHSRLARRDGVNSHAKEKGEINETICPAKTYKVIA